MNRYQSFKAYLTYRKAVMMADKAHRSNGGRYYVIPCASERISLIVTDRKNFRLLQRKHYIDTHWNIDDVKHRSFYFTADRGGNDAPTEEILKTRQFIYQYWYDVRLNEIKDGKRRRRITFIRRLLPFIKAK